MKNTKNLNSSSIQNFLITFKIIHLGLVLGVTAFGIFVWMQNSAVSYGMRESDFFIYLVPIVALMGYFASKTLFQKMIAAIALDHETKAKLGKYQTASLIKYALLEGPALLSFFAFMQERNALYLAIGIGLCLLLAFERPTKKNLEQQLPLTWEEKQSLKP